MLRTFPLRSLSLFLLSPSFFSSLLPPSFSPFLLIPPPHLSPSPFFWQSGLETKYKVKADLWPSCLHLSSVGITGMHHQCQCQAKDSFSLLFFFLIFSFWFSGDQGVVYRSCLVLFATTFNGICFVRWKPSSFHDLQLHIWCEIC